MVVVTELQWPKTPEQALYIITFNKHTHITSHITYLMYLCAHITSMVKQALPLQ